MTKSSKKRTYEVLEFTWDHAAPSALELEKYQHTEDGPRRLEDYFEFLALFKADISDLRKIDVMPEPFTLD